MTKVQDLRDRVVLIHRKIVEDADGSFKEQWQEGDIVWAQVIPALGREYLGEGWNNINPMLNKYKVIMRYRKTRFARVQWKETLLALSCSPLMDPRFLWMTCFMHELRDVK